MVQQEPEERNINTETDIAKTEDIEELKRIIDEEREKAEKYLANWQRTQADFMNYKRRSEQEKEEHSKFANSVIILGLLPVLDDFERAIAAIPPRLSKAGWVDGIRLIERKLRTSLEAQGLSTIEALGEQFDPHFHEAVRQAEGKEGIIVEEVQKGYMLRDRVIRPSKVVVGNGDIEEKENNRENSV